MSADPRLCAEPVVPICAYLAERWRHKNPGDDHGRRELEMATVLVLRWITSGDPVTEEKVRKVAAILGQ